MKNSVRISRSAIMTFVIAAAAAFMVSMPQSASAKKKIGFQLYNVMGSVRENPKVSIERIAKMGYNSVELVQWGGDPKVFGLSAEEFKAICDANGVKITSTHSSIQEDPAKEEEIMNNWRKLFAIQKACGGKYFVIPSYQCDFTMEGVQRMCAYFNRVGKIAKEYGLTLGYHNHAHEFKTIQGTNTVMWEYLVEHTDAKNVCFELDVYWCTKGGKDPVAYLKKYPKRIKLLHIKDDFVIGASGTINFEGIFTQFKKNKMKDYFVEVETPGWLNDKKNADGSKYSDKQKEEEKFKACEESAKYLLSSPFVK